MNLSLRARLLGISIVAVFVIVVALVWETSISVKDQTLNALLNDVQHFSSAYGKGVGQWLGDRQKVLHSLTEKLEQNPDKSPYDAISQAFSAGGFGVAFYGTEKGQMFRQDPQLDENNSNYDPRKKSWYKDALAAGKLAVSDPIMSTTLKQMVIIISEPVRVAGEVVGAVGGNLTLDQLTSQTKELQVPGKGYAIMVDREGKIIAHPDDSLQNKAVADISPMFEGSQLNKMIQDNRLFEGNINGQNSLIYAQGIPNSNWALIFVMNKSVLMQPLYSLVTKQVVIALILLVIFIAVLVALFKVMFRNLEKVAVALEDIAEGEGDLTVRIQVDSKDEIARLAGGFNRFVERMQGIISRLRDTAVKLTAEADAVANGAHASSRRVQVQQDEVNMVATAVTEMASATQEIAGNAENTASAAQNSVSLSKEGQQQVQQSQHSIQDLAEEVAQATGTINELNQHAQQISTILATITGIAEQTNLLALNAAIEAARAGEQGRGFAVVADEVRVLSQRTHSSTEEIQQMIETLQQTTAKAVKIMERGHSLAHTSVEDANAAQQRLAQITDAISSIADMATQIASAAEEQTSVTSEINRNTESIRGVANDMADESAQAASQAKVLHELSRQVESEVNRFRL
ncbi:methyl-accepting chemotaxis protein [Gallaecimonas mangrovi]|uniref:methyl-accepting chemotaxis protein n=1 Tax=Gallaecimonas mangrovi TaxID=2291597 RepID=UPI000E1FF11D|nr:methyl-accepting chemotaxis protein [Gallaecimonas mangrovi]